MPSNIEQERLNAVKNRAEARVAAMYKVAGVMDKLRDAAHYVRDNTHQLFRSHPIPDYGDTLKGGVKTLGHGIGEMLRESTFGSPLTLRDIMKQRYEQAGQKWAPAIGAHIKEFYTGNHDTPLLYKALNLMPVALGAGRAIFGDPSRRGENLGGALASAAAAPFTARMGLAAAPLGAMAYNFGSNVGHLFDPRTNPQQEDTMRHGRHPEQATIFSVPEPGAPITP